MEIGAILETIDKLYDENRGEEAEQILLGAIGVAQEEQDGMSLLQLLNELIGYYREASRVQESYIVADRILEVANQILPVESVPYATSLLNIATAYRAGGRLQDAMELYRRVEKIYHEILPEGSVLMASLYNNESLDYQEMQDFEKAAECLQKALKIVVAAGEEYDEAVTRANLAGTLVQLGDLENAKEQALLAAELFQKRGVSDGHYAAALSALGSYYYVKENFSRAAECFLEGMGAMEKSLGRNAFYERLRENYEASLNAADSKEENHSLPEGNDHALRDEKNRPLRDGKHGLDICRRYYEAYGKPMLESQFSEYMDAIAVGLCGAGSDCFGCDDVLSRDHDWGPSFCIFINRKTNEAIGKALRAAYEALPNEFEGMACAPMVQGQGRRGVLVIEDYYENLLGAYPTPDWRSVSDVALAESTNGEIWMDGSGEVTAIRRELSKGYPAQIQFLKLAESCARFSQTGQYNLARMLERGDTLTAKIMEADAIREAMRIVYYAENVYPPHDKWLHTMLMDLENGPALDQLFAGAAGDNFEQVGAFLANLLYKMDFISDIDSYLDHQTQELLQKSFFVTESSEELSMRIAKAEFEAFDKVQNEGGRASCQNNWPTFSIMRRSQYLTWDQTMQMQYLYDFLREYKAGHNLITEKYGRMMESTAPERYAQIRENFPELTQEQKAIIEQIVAIQVGWMEEFAATYPALADQARSVHTYDDNPYNTSYETYLRGELGTYSDKMLQLYARFIVGLYRDGKNLAFMTMENSAHLYGYETLADAERFMKA